LSRTHVNAIISDIDTLSGAAMGQVLVRSIADDTIESYRIKAKLNGSSLEQELRVVIEANKALTPEQRVQLVRELRTLTKPSPAITLDEIREGLM
jgi:plasmid stability protein